MTLATVLSAGRDHRCVSLDKSELSRRYLSQSRLRKSEQDDKWSFCLTAGTLCPANQEKQ
jgi:hypothetical protein